VKKRVLIGSIVAGAVLIGAISSNGNQPQPSALSAAQSSGTSSVAEKKIEVPTCDGTSVTINCTVDGIKYATYVYHPGMPEKSHDETVTTYKQEVSGYCTLCSDGTYSPSCATGRGACSHHDGVAQWNAPRYRNTPVYATKKVVDAPAQEAYYEKVTQ
jgi:hypothetical protein